MSISTPTKITVPFANSAGSYKNTIPVASQVTILPGAASFTDGFPPLTMTPKLSGGIPPFGQDMNGILYNVTQALQFAQAGGSFPYDSAFATTVGGYPLGAIVQATDGSGFWLNQIANNTTAPESFGANWSPLQQSGNTLVTMTSSNVTLTALQAGKDTIVISGTLTADLNLILPTYQKQWLIVNNCTGAFSVTAKTASGSGVSIYAGTSVSVYGNGTNIIAFNYGIGVGQTWTDVTASRALTTTYTNTTGKPIFVSVYNSGSPNAGYTNLIIGGINLGRNGALAIQSGTMHGTVSGIVPSGITYSATGTGLVSWMELR